MVIKYAITQIGILQGNRYKILCSPLIVEQLVILWPRQGNRYKILCSPLIVEHLVILWPRQTPTFYQITVIV